MSVRSIALADIGYPLALVRAKPLTTCRDPVGRGPCPRPSSLSSKEHANKDFFVIPLMSWKIIN